MLPRMRKLSTSFAAAALLLLTRTAAADLYPDPPADCTAAYFAAQGASCVDCMIDGEGSALNCAAASGPAFLDGPEKHGYPFQVCSADDTWKGRALHYEVWCSTDAGGGCATSRAGHSFDAGMIALLLGTAAYVGWSRRRR